MSAAPPPRALPRSVITVVVATAAWWLMVAIGVRTGALLGVALSFVMRAHPNLMELGGWTGAAIAMAAAGLIGWRLGMRWWWGFVAAVIAVCGALWGNNLPWFGWWGPVLLAPAIGAAASEVALSSRPPRDSGWREDH